VVYPAAGLIATAKTRAAAVLEVNLAASGASHLADVSLLGPSGEVLPRLVEQSGR
jgi:NAD-dependent deacetylase